MRFFRRSRTPAEQASLDAAVRRRILGERSEQPSLPSSQGPGPVRNPDQGTDKEDVDPRVTMIDATGDSTDRGVSIATAEHTLAAKPVSEGAESEAGETADPTGPAAQDGEAAPGTVLGQPVPAGQTTRGDQAEAPDTASEDPLLPMAPVNANNDPPLATPDAVADSAPISNVSEASAAPIDTDTATAPRDLPEPAEPEYDEWNHGRLSLREGLRRLFRRDRTRTLSVAEQSAIDAEGGLRDAPLRQADVLRALGRVLDTEGAVEAEVVADAEGRADDPARGYCALAWTGDRVHWVDRSYTQDDLTELAGAARQGRGATVGQPPTTQSELLRTLGQELDREGARLRRVRWEGRRFRVQVLADDSGIVQLYYAIDELEVLSRHRRTSREPPPPLPPGRLFGHGPSA